jgi:hypothetical protein
MTVETPIFSVIVHKNQLKLMGLIHAMRSNGPLPQVCSFTNTLKLSIIPSDSHSVHTIECVSCLCLKIANRMHLQQMKW